MRTLLCLAALVSVVYSTRAQVPLVPKPATNSGVILGPAAAAPPKQPRTPIVADIMIPLPGGGHWHRSVPPGFKIIDGDMLMPLSFNPEVDGFYVANLWTSGTVPYTFDPAFSGAESSQVVTAMNSWSALANISWIARTNQADYIYFQRSDVNNSSIGRTGGRQVINFAPNQAQRVYIHELGHCLGLLHEHQRGDRGSFISVNQSNVQSAFWGDNFPIINGGTFWGPYDFPSIMHYDRCAFSTACAAGSTCNCMSTQESMTALAAYSDWNSIMGTADAQSYLDGITMRGLYAFVADRWLDQSSGAPSNGTFQQPYNGSFGSAFNAIPVNGTLILKRAANHSAVGTYNKAVKILAPAGAATLAN